MITLRKVRLQPTPIGLSSQLYVSWTRLNQALVYWPLRFLTHILFKPQTSVLLSLDDLAPEYSYIVASNHQSGLDPFVVCTQMPRAIYRRLSVFRYFAHTALFTNLIMRGGLLSLGSFPTHALGNLPYGLEAALAYEGRGQTIMIFPEGRRVIRGEREARPGIAVLAANSRVRIIPTHIAWTRTGYFRRSFHLTIGKPFDAVGMSPQSVLDVIYALPLDQKV